MLNEITSIVEFFLLNKEIPLPLPLPIACLAEAKHPTLTTSNSKFKKQWLTPWTTCVARRKYVLCVCCAPGRNRYATTTKSQNLFLVISIHDNRTGDRLARERERTLYSTSKSCSKYDRKRDQTRGIIESIRRRRDTMHKFGHDNKGIQVAQRK